VLSSALIAFQTLLAGGWSGTRRAMAEAEAIEIARARLAAVGTATPLRPGEITGTEGLTTAWRIIIAPANIQPALPPRIQRTGFWVTAEVRFQDDRTQEPRFVRLTTLKLGPRS
jgi:hypothetical protein